MNENTRRTTATFAMLACCILPAASAETYNPALWSGLRYRMIGPERGGRVTAVTGVPSQPYTFYMGSTGGGVWKTTDAGHTWVNVSDGFFSVGVDGRSRGLAVRSEYRLRGHRLVQDPQQCVDRPRDLQIHRRGQDVDLRRPARCGADRDCARSSHQSEHRRMWPRWGIRSSPTKSAAFIAPTTAARPGRRSCSFPTRPGAADLELQPGNPNVVFACMWHGQRKPWTIISGAREGGIYKSTDGGDTLDQARGRPAERAVRPQQRRHFRGAIRIASMR